MNRKNDLKKLSELTTMLRDLELSRLEQAASALAATKERLTDLDQPKSAEGIDMVAEALAALRYQVWADQRRAELAALIRRQEEQVQGLKEKARTALGRADVMSRLSGRRDQF